MIILRIIFINNNKVGIICLPLYHIQTAAPCSRCVNIVFITRLFLVTVECKVEDE